MLVLTRKRGEEIVIGEGDRQVVVTLFEIQGHRCRIGIHADPDVPIRRGEVEPRKSAEEILGGK